MLNRNFFIFCLLTIFAISPSRTDSSIESIEKRILGGTSTRSANVASVRLRHLQGTFHICGGFIINKHWVGTAGQCLTGKTINNTVVAVGSHLIGGGTIYELNRIEKHHNYNALTLANDIGLLRTFIEIIFSATVRPIPLRTQILGIEWVFMFGWGRTAEGTNLSNDLLETAFLTLSHAECLTRFPFVVRRFISDRHVCAMWTTRATCPGDAGGPLIFNNAVVGIISWVEPCVPGQPNVNTRISAYTNWILSFTREDD